MTWTASRTPHVTPQRWPVPALITLANAKRARRLAGARSATAADPFDNLDAACGLLEPLGLTNPLKPEDLADLKVLADQTRAITDSLASGERPGSVSNLNRLAAAARADQTLQVDADGNLFAELHWEASTAVAELACRIVTELGRLDPSRLRRCAREACDLLFYDVTRSSTQRWHSDTPCGLRERQERWRKAASEKKAASI